MSAEGASFEPVSFQRAFRAPATCAAAEYAGRGGGGGGVNSRAVASAPVSPASIFSPEPLFKFCSACGETKPRTLEFFPKKNARGQLSSRCRPCKNLLRPQLTTMRTEKKLCGGCGEEKPFTPDFFRKVNRLGRLGSRCKSCASVKTMTHYNFDPIYRDGYFASF